MGLKGLSLNVFSGCNSSGLNVISRHNSSCVWNGLEKFEFKIHIFHFVLHDIGPDTSVNPFQGTSFEPQLPFSRHIAEVSLEGIFGSDPFCVLLA